MQRFKLMRSLQKLASVDGFIDNHFNKEHYL